MKYAALLFFTNVLQFFPVASLMQRSSLAYPSRTRISMSSSVQSSTSSHPPILVVGLNPALQKRFHLPSTVSLLPGSVHRAAHIEYGIGGKGQNVAHALSFLVSGNHPYATLLQFVGSGSNGDELLSLERQQLGDKIIPLTIETLLETRLCTTIVSDKDATELVEPSGAVDETEVAMVLNAIEKNFPNGIETCCIMGSLPPSCHPSLYRDIIRLSSPSRLLLDTVVGLNEISGELSTERRQKATTAMLKINLDELSTLAGMARPCQLTLREISALVENLEKKLGALPATFPFIAVTNGKDPAYFVATSKEGVTEGWKMSIPFPGEPDKEKTRLYPIGAGDAVAAGTLAAWEAICSSSAEALDEGVMKALRPYIGKPSHAPPQAIAFAFGLACGGASCLENDNSVLKMENVYRIFGEMMENGWEKLL